MAKNTKDIFMEVALDLDNLSHELSTRLNIDEMCTFVQSMADNCEDVELDEALFLSQLRTMINIVESCPEDYAATKWEMLPAMKGLLDK